MAKHRYRYEGEDVVDVPALGRRVSPGEVVTSAVELHNPLFTPVATPPRKPAATPKPNEEN